MPTQKEIVDAVATQLQRKDLSQQAVMVLQRATAKVLERIKQNVDAQIKEDSSPIIEEFVGNVANKLSSMTQQWHDGIKNDMVIFPENTRFIFRDGRYTTIVVEQPPQVRHINFGGKKQYALAFPYVQFILTFQNHKPAGKVVVGVTKRPISDLDKPICHPPLPNITEHVTCMGDYTYPHEGNMTDMVNDMIGTFWQSAFTSDASQHFNGFLADNGLESLEDWERKSLQDPLFVVAHGTKYHIGRTVRGFLTVDNGGKGSTVSLVNNIKQEIITAVGTIGGALQGLMTGTDIKVENREKVHVETLEGILKEIIVQAYAELWEYLQKQLLEERKKLQSEMEAAAKKLKTDFMYYMDKTGGKKATW